MGRKSQIQIKETLEELYVFKKSCKTIREEKRVVALIHLKEDPTLTQASVAESLGVSDRTMRKWLNQYVHEGIEKCLPKRTRDRKSRIITQEVHDALLEKLEDTSDPLLGYWHACEWVAQKFGLSIRYHWLRKYMVEKMDAKLKQPRKSHINKDQEAEAVFFANSVTDSKTLDLV